MDIDNAPNEEKEKIKKIIDKLTPEQEKLMVEVKKEYLDRFFTFRDIDEKLATQAAAYAYDLAGYKEPKVIIVDSPLQAQVVSNELMGTKKVWYDFSTYLSYFDLVWLSFYDFFDRIGVVYDDCPEYYEYKRLVRDAHIYDSVQFDEAIVLVRLPVAIHRDNDVLHHETQAAIEFKDGFKLCFWHGVHVPQKLILQTDSITKQDLFANSNAEVRRAFREKLGGKKYYDLLTDGQGLRKVDSVLDKQGNVMTLWETKKPDEVIRKKVQFLECECPSTGRIYNIYPPNQNCTTAWEAKESTFSGKKLAYRHGDLGLVRVGDAPEFPEMET
jgi:hypothetical protein